MTMKQAIRTWILLYIGRLLIWAIVSIAEGIVFTIPALDIFIIMTLLETLRAIFPFFLGMWRGARKAWRESRQDEDVYTAQYVINLRCESDLWQWSMLKNGDQIANGTSITPPEINFRADNYNNAPRYV